MHTKKVCTLASVLLFTAAFNSVTARAQTDIALSINGAFSNTVGANNVDETADNASNAAGGMIELRHFRSHLTGYEATYSFNRANQVYSAICEGRCGPSAVSANAHELTGDWVISSDARKYRLFALGGMGLLLTVPTSGQSYTHSAHTAVYVYGVGVDWKLQSRLGLRFQYRGNIHRAPYILFKNYSTDPFQHTAEPMIGAYYRF